MTCWATRRWSGLCAVCVLAACGAGGEVSAATPNSPEVRAMLSRALAYLNKAPVNTNHANQLGGAALMGLAAYKYQQRFGEGAEALPPLTQTALTRILTVGGSEHQLRALDNYSLGIALVFLTEVYPDEHPHQIEIFLGELLSRQKPNGAWGYPTAQKGDTSQLQYAALGLWSARASGREVPVEAMRYLMDYLLRTQDPNGAWGYQGTDPGTFTRVPQEPMRPSLWAAGLGSLYVTAEFLGVSTSRRARQAPERTTPPALQPVLDRQSSAESGGLSAEAAERLKQGFADGKEWFRQNPGLRTGLWQFYFLYAYERMESFREKVEGNFQEQPAWYNEGVWLLRELQTEDGSWGRGSLAGSDDPVATAFAMLFLLRSTRESIAKVVERDGILRGGYDLPADLSEVRLQNNRLVAPVITGEVEDLIRMVEEGDEEKIEQLLNHPDALSLTGLSGDGREYSARLARILRAGSFEGRLVAARALGRQGNLDHVPMLVYALSDPDPRVVREAQAGLRLTSRKFAGFDLSDNPPPAELQAMIGKWKQWYESVRPGATFIE